MSTPMIDTGEEIPMESQQPPKVPDPGTESHTHNLPPRAIAPDVRLDEERIPGMVKESTVWDVYNNEARKVDNELVKDWTTSLNFLLVFVSSPYYLSGLFLVILIGGYLCGCSHRIYHREQEDAGTGPDGNPRRHCNTIFQ
jgi:hypothetical protein